MKASSLYFVLATAHVAICAPMATSLTRQTEEVTDTGHGIATQPRVWSTLDRQGDAPGRDRHDSVPPHPIDRNILPPHSNRRIPKTQSQETPEINVIQVPHPVHDENDVLELQELDAAGSRQPGTPCQGMSYSERNNMLIVFLAVAFFVVVVVMETYGSVFRRQGAIRLEEPSSQPSLSIRETPHSQVDIGDEKRRI